MDEQIKKLWIEALESNKYKQGYKNLKSLDNCYCCLGVLFDVVKEKLNITWEQYNSDNSNSELLSYDILKFCGLSFIDQNILIRFNDCNKYSFIFISNWIKGHL